MYFRLRKEPTIGDISIATLHIKEVMSDDIIQIVDFSNRLENNPISAIKNMSSVPKALTAENDDDRYLLQSESTFGKINITNEYFYNTISNESIPLWFSHCMKHTYFNSNSIQKTIKRVIRKEYKESDRIITAMIPASGNYIILGDSVSVEKTKGSDTGFLDRNHFFVDYGKGTVKILSDIVENEDEYIIRYTLLPIDVTVITFGNEIYRLEVWPALHKLCSACNGIGCDTCNGKKYIPYSNNYILNILCTDNQPIYVSYKSSTTTDLVEEIEEYTTPTNIFNIVDNNTRKNLIATIDNDWDVSFTTHRVFSILQDINYNDSIYVTCYNPDMVFTFRPDTIYDTKIKITKPKSLGFNIDWYPSITKGEILTHDGNYFSTGSPNEVGTTISISETARIIDPVTISVAGGYILAMYTYDDKWYGVTVRKSDGSEINVQSIDLKNGIIKLEEKISRLEVITVDYQTNIIGNELHNICINPLITHEYHNNNIIKNIILFMLAENDESHKGQLPVYIKILDKYVDAQPVTYTYDEINNKLNSSDSIVRNAYRNDILDLPSKYNGDILYRLEPLALVYAINPLDEDGYLVEDARIYGGGTTYRNRSFYEHSLYGGELADMELYLKYHIPIDVYNDLISRAKMWDESTIISDSPDSSAKSSVMNLLKNKVKKYSLLGTKQEVIIE